MILLKWNRDSALRAANTIDAEGVLWVLYLAGNTEVGVGKTSDYHSQKSSVRAYAKNQGLSDPGVSAVKTGYENITGKTVIDAKRNRDYINREKKPELLCLTPLGKTLLSTVHNNARVRRCLEEFIGIDSDEPEDPWHILGDPDADSPISIRTYADESMLEQPVVDIEVIATFDCERCGTSISRQYDLRFEDGYPPNGWSRHIKATCSNEECETGYGFLAGDVYQPPELL